MDMSRPHETHSKVLPEQRDTAPEQPLLGTVPTYTGSNLRPRNEYKITSKSQGSSWLIKRNTQAQNLQQNWTVESGDHIQDTDRGWWPTKRIRVIANNNDSNNETPQYRCNPCKETIVNVTAGTLKWYYLNARSLQDTIDELGIPAINHKINIVANPEFWTQFRTRLYLVT